MRILSRSERYHAAHIMSSLVASLYASELVAVRKGKMGQQSLLQQRELTGDPTLGR